MKVGLQTTEANLRDLKIQSL